jgi:serine/threonine protein phosphatase 1
VFLGNVLRDPSLLTEWLHVGGQYTLMSYGLTLAHPWG